LPTFFLAHDGIRLAKPDRLCERDYRETWRLFASHAGYRYELKATAARLLRQYHLPSDRACDVVHDALLILLDRLRRRGDLGFDPGLGQAAPRAGLSIGLARLAHRPVADFVRNRAVAAGYDQNSHDPLSLWDRPAFWKDGQHH
jgi:hypothetical protein